MKIAIIGQAAFGKDVLVKLLENDETVSAVICPPDNDQSIDPMKLAALEHEIPVYQYNSMRDKSAIKEFASLGIDLCVMAFVTDIVPSEILSAPTFGTIQYHPSLLPRHRGPSSINWPIIKGERKTGLSIFWPDEGLDTGPILIQKEVAITSEDTLGSLYFGKLFPLGVDAMLEAVQLIKDKKAPRIDQNHNDASYEGWCSTEEAHINWGQPASDIYNLIRGCDPSPGANTSYQGDRISFFDASYKQTKIPITENGTVVSVCGNHLGVKVEDGLINIGRVRFGKGPKLSASEFIAKHGVAEGSKFPS
jgi:methionyl-tRNA formyltransferase